MTINYSTNIAARLNLHKFKDVEFATQELIIPAIESVFPTVSRPRSDVQLAPQMVRYSPFTIEFILMEDLSNYRSLVDWMQAATTAQQDTLYTDATLFILNGAKGIASQITFYDMFPSDLSQVQYTTQAQGITYQKATATFRYHYYKFT